MKKIIALAIATAISAPAMADLTIGADIETNTTITNNDDFDQGGRVAVSFAGSTTAESGMFASAKTVQEFGLNGGRAAADTYLEIGSAAGSVKLGYVRESEVWAQPGDVYVAAAGATLYKGTAQRARNANNVILSVNAGPAVLQAMVRPDQNASGDMDTRLVATAALGGVNVGAAVESDADSVAAAEGYVVHADAMVGGVALGGSYAKNDADTKTFTVTAGVAGLSLGYINSEWTGNGSDHYYVAYPIADVAGVTGLKATIAASAGETDAGADESGVRLRFNYAF